MSLKSLAAALAVAIGLAPAASSLPASAGVVPDGRTGRIVFVEFSSSAPSASELDVVNADKSGLHTILSMPENGMDFPRWSPDGTKVAFEMMATNQLSSHIFVVNADGTSLKQLTRGKYFDQQPSWSPDGTTIAFASDRSANADLWVLDVATKQVTQITSDVGADRSPAWSPDGTQIAFASDRAGSYDIWAKTLSDGSVTRLTTSTGDDDYPAWSPGGGRIAFASDRAGDWSIYAMASDGTRLVRVTQTSSVEISPSWSPDSRRIAFDSDRGGAGFDIYVHGANGNGGYRVTNLTDQQSNAIDPDWTE